MIKKTLSTALVCMALSLVAPGSALAEEVDGYRSVIEVKAQGATCVVAFVAGDRCRTWERCWTTVNILKSIRSQDLNSWTLQWRQRVGSSNMNGKCMRALMGRQAYCAAVRLVMALNPNGNSYQGPERERDWTWGCDR